MPAEGGGTSGGSRRGGGTSPAVVVVVTESVKTRGRGGVALLWGTGARVGSNSSLYAVQLGL